MEYVSLIASAVLGLIGWLLVQKDQAQQREIQELRDALHQIVLDNKREHDRLWEKHEADAKELHVLTVQVANDHYKKSEMDSKFSRLEMSLEAGFAGLRELMLGFQENLNHHINTKHGKD